MFDGKRVYDDPPFDDESIKKMEDELRKAVEDYKTVNA